MSARRRRSRRNAGYTLIEVMMALGVLTAGAVGIMAMVQASTRGNMEAREMATGTQLAQRWLERLRRDATNWTASSRSLNPVILSRTTYLQTVPNPGTPAAWVVPVPPAVGPDRANFDYYGRDTAITTEMHFCTNTRLTWLYVGRSMRADVRVWWLRREGGIGTDLSRAALGQCAPGLDPETLTNDWRVRMAYASTVIRWTPTP
ncbi:MAG: prepilin-type N-terminal cleavage/methylation domain-containing protein [Sandaracinaceae bacterium]|nr:prepilin-type N-terminal cleavage/methylation domain-containing protein [Sandaracinaceae bacterium]